MPSTNPPLFLNPQVLLPNIFFAMNVENQNDARNNRLIINTPLFHTNKRTNMFRFFCRGRTFFNSYKAFPSSVFYANCISFRSTSGVTLGRRFWQSYSSSSWNFHFSLFARKSIRVFTNLGYHRVIVTISFFSRDSNTIGTMFSV